MRILQVIWFGSMGGLEKYVLELSKQLQKKGYAPELLILSKSGIIAGLAKEAKIPVHHLDFKGSLDLCASLRLFHFLKNNKYDLFHFHDRNFLVLLLFALFSKTKRVFTDHGGELIGDSPWKRNVFYKTLSFQFSKIITNSFYIKKILIERGLIENDKVVTIYNGIDISKFKFSEENRKKARAELSIPEDVIVVGVVGRLVYCKGIDIFIEVAKQITNIIKSKQFMFLIIGDGALRSEYEAIVKNNIVKDCVNNIRFLGWRSDSNSIMCAFDFYLFTSRWEAFGLSLAEAMALEIPVIGFDTSGANEVVCDGRYKYFFPQGQTNLLIEELEGLIKNTVKVREIVLAGKQRILNNFTLEANFQNVEKIYKELLCE